MRVDRVAILLSFAVLGAGCDRLVLRHDATDLPSPILTESQAIELGSRVRRSVGDIGYREIGACSSTAVAYCGKFENPNRGQLVVSVPRDNPSKLEADFSSLGNLVDQSAEAFDAVRKASQ